MTSRKRIRPSALVLAALVAASAFIPLPAAADWDPPRRVTKTGTMSLSPDLAVAGGVIHLMWMELNPDTYRGQLRYTQSDDGGVTWSKPRRMTKIDLDARRPRIEAAGGILHLVWTDDRRGESQVFYRRSENGGATWSAPKRLSFAPDGGGGWCETVNPDLAVAGSEVHVAWNDLCGAEVYTRRSPDGGATWKKTRRISDGQIPAIAASGDWVAAAWEAGISSVEFSASTDSGKNWSASQPLSASISHDGAVAARANRIDVVWSNQGPGNPEIFWKTTIDGGQSWVWQRITKSSVGEWCPQVLRAGPSGARSINFVWKRYNGGSVSGDADVYHKARVTILGSKTWVTKRVSMSGESTSGCPAMTADEANMYIAFSDDAPGNHEIFFRRFAISSG